jgi:acetate kinase
VATNMGSSPLSGLVMGIRPGDLDPGLLQWLMGAKGMSSADIESMLYRESGGWASPGSAATCACCSPARTREAIGLFVDRVCREVGSLPAALGGLGALVFTGGIGEHAAPIRAAMCRQCAWLGLVLDEAANRPGGPQISTRDARVRIWIVPTDEEPMIARHTTAMNDSVATAS